MFYRNENLAIFVDGPGLYSATRALGFDIDYKLLKDEFSQRSRLIRINYYTPLIDNDSYSPVRPLVDWLQYNGYTVLTKPAKEFTDAAGRRKVKGSIAIDLAVGAMETSAQADHIVLFTGDGIYRPLVQSLKRKGVRVTVVSTLRSAPPVISDDLRREADDFTELDDLRNLISRTPPQEEERIALGCR